MDKIQANGSTSAQRGEIPAAVNNEIAEPFVALELAVFTALDIRDKGS